MFSAAKNRIIHENYQTALMKKFLLNIAASACLVCMATATATSAALKPSAGKRNIPESSVTRDRCRTSYRLNGACATTETGHPTK